MTLFDRPQRAVKRAAAHLLTATAFFSVVVGQGFRPCPHHASLDIVGHGVAAQASSRIASPLDRGLASSSSESNEADACLCVDGCDLGSGRQIPSDPTWSSFRISSPRSVALDRESGTELPAANVHLIPLAQPPPHDFGHLI